MVTTSVTLTFEQYLTYDDGTDKRYELVDGKLVEMPEASPLHSDIVDLLDDSFKAEVQRLNLDWRVKPGNVGIRTGVRSSRTPDVAVIEGSVWRSLRESKIPSAILQVPMLLAVEVVSPGKENLERDYEAKKREYEASGISEYWIVDPQQDKILLFLLVDGQYQVTEFTGEQKITSKVFPELNLTAQEILNV